jgi:hypothetical protein
MGDCSDLIDGKNALYAFGYERLSSQMNSEMPPEGTSSNAFAMSFTLAKKVKSASSGEYPFD